MFVDLEHDLYAHLKSVLGDVPVFTAAELADVTADRQTTPAVHLVYDGYKVKEIRPDGRVVRIDQKWLIVIACKNVRDMRSGQESRNEAGELAEKILKETMGFGSKNASGAARLADAPKPAYVDGITYFPLAFLIETTLKGDKQ